MLKKIFLVVSLSFILSTPVWARIYIVIDEASNHKFPIAVPQFVTPSGGSSGSGKKMTDLVKKDLNIAGLFQVMDEASFPHDDKDVDRIDFSKWEALDVKALVKGIVKGGTVEIRLYDVAERKMILGRQYTVDGKNTIDAVHRYVDSLMGVLTGTRGPFESKIAASCGKPFKRVISTFEMDGVRRGGMTSGGINNISPVWSPDGSRIAYTAFTSRFPEVYISSGGKGQQVTHFNSTTITPAWTPDGSSLVVASAHTGDTELYQVSLSGRIIKQITRSTNIDLAPAFSPDGRIAFASERAGGLQLFATSLGGGGATQLTYTGYQNDSPDWSPDGTKIVFSGRDRGAFDIFVMDADGSNIQRLTRDEGNNESPVWSPDSRYVAYTSSRGGIFVMLEDGTSQTLIEKSGGCINTDWGPWLSKE